LKRLCMYIERDREFDQLYINLSDHFEEGSVAHTVEATPGVNLDLDAKGKLLGIEIVGATDVIGTPADQMNFSGELVGVKEAAELSGKDKANFLRDLASREDFPKPVVELASGRYWLSREIERYLRKEKIAG
jgi:uncharacterized protein YuzE